MNYVYGNWPWMRFMISIRGRYFHFRNILFLYYCWKKVNKNDENPVLFRSIDQSYKNYICIVRKITFQNILLFYWSGTFESCNIRRNIWSSWLRLTLSRLSDDKWHQYVNEPFFSKHDKMKSDLLSRFPIVFALFLKML